MSSPATAARLASLLERPRFEVLPLPGVRRAVRVLPEGASVAITADPVQGMTPTVDLAVELAGQGFEVIPHLGAQNVADEAELAGHLERLTDAGIEGALIVGGVADEPGEYFDALDLLEGIGSLGSPLRVGVGGYPEGHHLLDDDVIWEALVAKAPRADWITTQICFDPPTVRDWLERVRAEGIDLPVWLGIPAVADLTGLMSFGLKVGAGRSLQFMFEHPRLVTRLLRPGGAAATRLATGLAELATDDALGIAGFHVFTYNQTRAAVRWRRRVLRRLG